MTSLILSMNEENEIQVNPMAHNNRNMPQNRTHGLKLSSSMTSCPFVAINAMKVHQMGKGHVPYS